MKVLKYTLKRDSFISTLKMPKDAMILSAQNIGRELVLFVSVMGGSEWKERTFEIMYSGVEVDDVPRFFISTVLFDFPIHVFERLS